MISLLDALSTLVVFALERGGDEDARVRGAISRAQVKMENIRAKAKAGWSKCTCCEMPAQAVVCWRCKQAMPEWMQRQDAMITEGADRRELDDDMIAWAIGHRRAA